MINGFTVVSLSVLAIVVSGQLLVYTGIIADELGLGGNPIAFFMFVAIVAIGIINSVIYIERRSKKDKLKPLILTGGRDYEHEVCIDFRNN